MHAVSLIVTLPFFLLKCRQVKGLSAEEGDSDEDGICASLEQVQIIEVVKAEDKTGNTSDLPSAPGKVEQSDTSDKGTGSDKQTDKAVHDGTSRTTMASRWAFEDGKTMQAMKDMNKNAARNPPKTWHKKRDELFNGDANVSNASPEMFTATTQRGDKKGKDGAFGEKRTKGSISAGPLKRSSSRVSSPISAGESGVGSNGVGLSSRSRPRTKASLLTGANLSAAGGDNGWADRSQKTVQLDRFMDGLLGRDVPPHMDAAKDTMSRLEARDFMQGGYSISQENSKRVMQGEIDVQNQGLQYDDHNEKLLESIARMEQRNVHMLSRPALSSMTQNSLIEDPHRNRHVASVWQ